MKLKAVEFVLEAPKYTQMDQNQAKSLILALIYSMFSTTAYPQRILLFEIQMIILFHEVPKKIKFPLFIVEKKTPEAVLLVPDLKTMTKWTLVLIYGRLYITDYS